MDVKTSRKWTLIRQRTKILTERDLHTHSELENPSNFEGSGEKNIVCVDSLLEFQKEVEKIVGAKIGLEKLKELTSKVSIERMKYHLEKWNIHKQNQVKPGAGYFITVVSSEVESF